VVAAVAVEPEPRCVLEERGCADAAPCALHATLYEAHDAFTGRLAEQSLASLAGLAEPAASRPRRARTPRPAAPSPPAVTEPVASGPRPSLGGWLD
jgi:DNA-binding IscR family transcriptional regulator